MLIGLLGEKSPFGESNRCGERRADLSTKFESGRVERLRQKESLGNWPFVVAADTGLKSGEGVMADMIGGRSSIKMVAWVGSTQAQLSEA